MGKTNRCNMQEDVTVKAEIVKKYKNTFLSCYFKRSPNAVLSEDFVFLSVFLIHLVKRCFSFTIHFNFSVLSKFVLAFVTARGGSRTAATSC